MDKAILLYKVSGGGFSFACGGDFKLAKGVCFLETDRGDLNPLRDGAEKGVKHDWSVHRFSENALEFRQSLKNLRADPLEISRIMMFEGRLEFEGKGWNAAHSELFLRENYFAGQTFVTGGLLAPLSQLEGEFGLSENFPFPGIAFTHAEHGTVLMGVLSQEKCKPCWRIAQSTASMTLSAEERFGGVPGISVEGGGEFDSERWIILFSRGGLEDALEEYYGVLNQRGTFRGADSILRNAVLWGSWNYNPSGRGFGAVSHERVVSNAAALARLAPDKPRFVMIDDGYQRGRSRMSLNSWFSSAFEIFYDAGRKSFQDTALFPGGMRRTAESIKKLGAEPAIWTTPRIPRDSALARERADMLLEFGGRDYLGRNSAYLDYSIPEAREYAKSAWNVYFREWGFKGVKLDFWSLPFEIPQASYRNREFTAVQLRNLFLRDLRGFIPEGGYLLTCVVANHGNPFIGSFADASRFGSDIGAGGRGEILRASSYLTANSPFFRHDCLLGDPDSIGWCGKLSAGDNRLWATMAFMCGGVCEIGGDLDELPGEGWEMLKIAAGLHGPARRTISDITFPGISRLPAGYLLREQEDGIYEAYLNWMWWPRIVDLHEPAVDIWTGEKISGKYAIPPKTAVLLKR